MIPGKRSPWRVDDALSTTWRSSPAAIRIHGPALRPHRARRRLLPITTRPARRIPQRRRPRVSALGGCPIRSDCLSRRQRDLPPGASRAIAVPGKTLVGTAQSHPTAGGVGSLAVGVGGLDVAVADGGGAAYLTMPRIVGIRLAGRLRIGSPPRTLSWKILRRLTVKGGVGRILEYWGPASAGLDRDRARHHLQHGHRVAAPPSLFPSDEQTLGFLARQDRAGAYEPSGGGRRRRVRRVPGDRSGRPGAGSRPAWPARTMWSR